MVLSAEMSIFRSRPEDFQVEELLRDPPCGAGPFLWLQVEKRGVNTDDVARELAAALGVASREVSWAGRKDRHAVTRQWFSIATRQDLGDVEIKGVEILRVARHDERLRLGEIMGNRFRIVVREVDVETARDAVRRLEEIAEHGMGNRFGAQRFGHGGENVRLGLEILRGERSMRDKRRATLMISALQAEVFNRVASRRGEIGGIDEVVVGDLAIEHDGGILFDVIDPLDERLNQRLASFKLSPTGPIFGTKMRRPRGEPARLEREVLAQFDLPEGHRLDLPRKLRVPGTRRALRVPVREVSSEVDEGSVELRFVLPSGSYATVLLEDLFPGIRDAHGSQDDLVREKIS